MDFSGEIFDECRLTRLATDELLGRLQVWKNCGFYLSISSPFFIHRIISYQFNEHNRSTHTHTLAEIEIRIVYTNDANWRLSQNEKTHN